MKKKLSLLLVLALLVSMIAGCSSAPATDDSSASESGTESTSESTSESEGESTDLAGNIGLDTLVVGTPEMNQDFINDFGNNSYDLAIKTLTGGYMNTYTTTDGGELTLNTAAVADVAIEDDAEGNRTYTFTLNTDIFWNDGTPITAQDYVASSLWKASPQWVTAGAAATQGEGLVGYTAYYEGTTTTLAGVKLISDTEFSLTLSAEKLPYFWEVSFADVQPISKAVYLPNATVMSDETGSWLEYPDAEIPLQPVVEETAEGEEATEEETTEEETTEEATNDPLLADCQRIAESERFEPTVTCGPYTFVSYENQTATLVLNEYFKGDLNGNKPTLTNVVQQAIPQDTDVEWAINGQVDLVAGVIEGEKIESAEASGTANLHYYLRAGYGNLAMHTDFGPTQDVNVRWALASLIDRSAVIDHVLGGYGGTVDGAYGMAQWMVTEAGAELQAEIKPISFNIDAANDYLDQSEYIYEADGTTPIDRDKFTADGSYLRHNAAGEELIINHLGTNDNPVTDIIEIQYAANAPMAGIKFNVTKSDFNALLENYYYGYDLGEDRVYHTFNLATNFTAVDDKYQSWHSDYLGTYLSATQLSDPEMDAITEAMRATDPADKEAYLETWVDFQLRWNELMPEIPLYSNQYYDITHINVNPLTTTPYANWYEKICEITKSDNAA